MSLTCFCIYANFQSMLTKLFRISAKLKFDNERARRTSKLNSFDLRLTASESPGTPLIMPYVLEDHQYAEDMAILDPLRVSSLLSSQPKNARDVAFVTLGLHEAQAPTEDEMRELITFLGAVVCLRRRVIFESRALRALNKKLYCRGKKDRKEGQRKRRC